MLKELGKEHSIENLQKVLECIFIKRCNKNIASFIKTAIDKFKNLKGAQSFLYVHKWIRWRI